MDTVKDDIVFLMESLVKLQQGLIVLFEEYDKKFQYIESKLSEMEKEKTIQYH